MRTAALLLLWTMIVLYPNPTRLLVSVPRAWAPPVDGQAVAALAATLPDDPRAIEALVTTRLVPYAVPWATYGVPWYFPTAAEVLALGQGDCQARAVLLASILEAKGMGWRLAGSFDHLWVDYPGKQTNALENAAVAIAAQQPDGGYALRWPVVINWRASWAIERAYFWDAMPASRVWLLVSGWAVVSLRTRLRRCSTARGRGQRQLGTARRTASPATDQA